jgi:hypothetical protein
MRRGQFLLSRIGREGTRMNANKNEDMLTE